MPVLWTTAAVAAVRSDSDRTRWLAFASGFVVIAVLVVVILVGIVNQWVKLLGC